MALNDLQRLLHDEKICLASTPSLYRCEAKWAWSEKAIQRTTLLLILGGRGEILIDNEAHSLRPGVCFFLSPGTRVAATHEKRYPLFLFTAQFELVDKATGLPIEAEKDLPRDGLFIRDTRQIESLAELIASRNRAGKAPDPLTEDAINMMLRLLLEAASKQRGRFNDRAYEALQAIELDLARKWTVAALAKEAGLSPTAFANVFTGMMNEPPIQYLVRRRMEEAKRQIQQSNLPIEEIAINLGYNDPRHFRVLFERYVGCPPADLRKGRLRTV